RPCIAIRPEQALSISGPLPAVPRLACPSPRTLDRLLPATFAAAHRLTGCSARKFGAVRRRGAGRCNPRHGKTRTWPRRDQHCIALRPEQALSISRPLPPFPRLACPSLRALDRLLPATFAAAHRLSRCSARKFGAVPR